MTSDESKSIYHLIEFLYQGVPYRYTNWTEDFEGYSSDPAISVETGTLTGTLQEEEASLGMPRDAFFESLLPQGQYPKVQVRVSEVVLGSSGQIVGQSSLFRGVVFQIIQNSDGISSRLKVECLSEKSLLDVPLGIPLLRSCPWRFTGRGCAATPSVFEYDVTVSSIDKINRIVTLSNVPSTVQVQPETGALVDQAVPDQWFSNGSIKVGGVLVPIVYWTSDVPGAFYVGLLPPDEWIGQTGTLKAGCLNTPAACAERLTDTRTFCGIGIQIPSYTPQFETGGN